MTRPPRIIHDLTGPEPAILIAAEMTLEESQLVEKGLRRLYDPRLPLSAATTIGNLITLFTRANERAEAHEEGGIF